MAQIVVLISSLIFADLQDPSNTSMPAAGIAETIAQCGGEIELASATPNPDQENTMFVSISLTEHADKCVRDLRTLDGVLAAYIKPAESLP